MSSSGTRPRKTIPPKNFEGNFFPTIRSGLGHPRRMKALTLFLLTIGSIAPAAESIQESFSAYGQLILTQLVSAPFPHPSRAEGHTYKDEFFSAAQHYADSTVAFFIPRNFRETPRIDFVIHFHGWRNTVEGTLRQYELIEQLAASGKNAILIVPEGPHDAPDSAGGKLEDEDGFKRFMEETLAVLKSNRVLKQDAALGNIILSGHSGGYQVIASIVARGGTTSHIREVWLFDALYAQSEKFLAWAETTRGRLLNIYTDTGGTKVRTEEMLATLKSRGATVFAQSDLEVDARALQTNRFVFLHTDLSHNEVVNKRKTFLEFLKTSCFENIREP